MESCSGQESPTVCERCGADGSLAQVVKLCLECQMVLEGTLLEFVQSWSGLFATYQDTNAYFYSDFWSNFCLKTTYFFLCCLVNFGRRDQVETATGDIRNVSLCF